MTNLYSFYLVFLFIFPLDFFRSKVGLAFAYATGLFPERAVFLSLVALILLFKESNDLYFFVYFISPFLISRTHTSIFYKGKSHNLVRTFSTKPQKYSLFSNLLHWFLLNLTKLFYKLLSPKYQRVFRYYFSPPLFRCTIDIPTNEAGVFFSLNDKARDSILPLHSLLNKIFYKTLHNKCIGIFGVI